VVDGEHRVGLAAAEVGLELHHRVAALAREALHAAHEQALQTLGEIGAAEELLRLLGLVRALAQVDLPEVRRELGLLVAPTRHVGVRRHDLAPGLERAGRGGLDQRAAGLALLIALPTRSWLVMAMTYSVRARGECLAQSCRSAQTKRSLLAATRIFTPPIVTLWTPSRNTPPATGLPSTIVPTALPRS